MFKAIKSRGWLDRNATRNKWHYWSQLINSTNVIMQVIMIMYQIFPFISWIMIHNLLLCVSHFALLANVRIILYCKKLLQEYHITGRYAQSQCVAVNKRKRKHKKKSQLCAHGLFYTKFNSQQLLFEAFLHGMRIFGDVESSIECILLFQYTVFQPY